MELTRRDFMKGAAAVGAAFGVSSIGILGTRESLAATGAPRVIWLQGQGCTGCSVSLLNTINYMTVDTLLLNTIDLTYDTTVMAAAGASAVAAAEANRAKPGYVLVVEGAIPTGAGGKYCTVWPGMTMHDAVRLYAKNAAAVLAVGTCACYGGMSAGKPNPTNAKGVRSVLSGKTVISIPGCPASPDWVIGTVAYFIKYGKAPARDRVGRPTDYYGKRVHDQCPFRPDYDKGIGAVGLGSSGCLYSFGCNGPETYCDCPTRKWNSPAAGAVGVNWCIGARSPCIGCTQPDYPDGRSPFYKLGTDGVSGATTTTDGGTGATTTNGGTGGTTDGSTGATTTTGTTTTGGGDSDREDD